jgi:hypothetical protein
LQVDYPFASLVLDVAPNGLFLSLRCPRVPVFPLYGRSWPVPGISLRPVGDRRQIASITWNPDGPGLRGWSTAQPGPMM